jgi:hypothetical protein
MDDAKRPLYDFKRFERWLREVLGAGSVLAAMLLQDGEEELVDFAERCRGIRRLVHVEAPSASADLSVLIRRWLKEPRRGWLTVNPIRFGTFADASGGSSSAGRAAAFQAACRGFEPRLPLHFRPTAVDDRRAARAASVRALAAGTPAISQDDVMPVVHARIMHLIIDAGLLLLAVAIVAVPIASQWHGRAGYERIVRCRAGHLYTSTVVPGVSLKSVRLWNARLQWCPVGRHWSLVRPVDESSLTAAERDAARSVHDAHVI